MKSWNSILSLSFAALLGGTAAFWPGWQPAGSEPTRDHADRLGAQAPQGASGVLLDPADTVVLLLDHQTGLFQTVKDIEVRDLRANTVVLAKVAELGKAPILTTASEPAGTNGPLMAELAHAAPNAKYIPRKGE